MHGEPLPDGSPLYGSLLRWWEEGALERATGEELAAVCAQLDSHTVCRGVTKDSLLRLVSEGSIDPLGKQSSVRLTDVDFGSLDLEGNSVKMCLRSRRCPLLLPVGKGLGRARQVCDLCQTAQRNLNKVKAKEQGSAAAYYDRLHRRTLVDKIEKATSQVADLKAKILTAERKAEAAVRSQALPVDEQLERLLTASVKGEVLLAWFGGGLGMRNVTAIAEAPEEASKLDPVTAELMLAQIRLLTKDPRGHRW